MTVMIEKLSRQTMIDSLRARDGIKCQYPDCGNTLDFSVLEGPLEVTIDHWMPQHYGKTNNWTHEQIWDLGNLKLMHKKCNAKKGDRVPNDDGTLPERNVRKFRYRRDKRAGRPEWCEACDNGHNLASDEVCASCGCTAKRFPRWAKVKANECNHDGIFWCWACSIGVVERTPAVDAAVLQAESGEWE